MRVRDMGDLRSSLVLGSSLHVAQDTGRIYVNSPSVFATVEFLTIAEGEGGFGKRHQEDGASGKRKSAWGDVGSEWKWSRTRCDGRRTWWMEDAWWLLLGGNRKEREADSWLPCWRSIPLLDMRPHVT